MAFLLKNTKKGETSSPHIKDFNEKIKSLYETDIGDFKRKALLYLNRLEETLQSQDEDNLCLPVLFESLKEAIICNNTRDIEILRLEIIKKSLQLEKSESLADGNR